MQTNIELLIKQSGKSFYALGKETGIQQSTISKWFNEIGGEPKLKPSLQHVVKLADYFNVSLDYLVGRELPQVLDTTPLSFGKQTREFADMFEQLNDKGREHVIKFINDLSESRIYEKQVDNF